MKKFCIFLILLSTVITSYAQQNEVVGRILDTDSLSVPGVAVIMQTLDSTYVNGGMSDADGYFRIESRQRPYRLLIQHIAYKPFMLESDKNNVGTIVLEEEVNELAGITVRATRPIMKIDNGRLDYDLKAIIENKLIDNAFDLLKELPSISSSGNSIDIIGTVGSTDILLSGRKSNMSLDQMIAYLRSLPSDRIEKIEVVYNPPASWHIKGSAINIILKEENKYSLQGQIQGNYANQYRNSYGGGGSLFLSSPKMSLDVIYSFHDERTKEKSIQQTLHTLGSEAYDIHSDMLSKDRRQYHNLYSSLKYHFADDNILDLSYIGEYAPKDIDNTSSKSNYFSDSYSAQKGNDYLHDISLTYTAPFGLKTGAEYTRFKNDGFQSLQYIRESNAIDALDYDMSQRIHRANFFADMGHDLPKGWSMTYGIKYDYTQNTNNQKYDDIEHNGAGSYNQSSETKEHITNIYFGLTKSFFENKLRASATLEGEFYKINDYKENSLLPRISLSYQINPKHYLSLAYNSFYVYPSYWDKQEYTIYENEYDVSTGNPNLLPQKFSFLNFMYILRNKYIFQILYQRVNDLIIDQSYQSQEELLNISQSINVDLHSNLLFIAVIPVTIAKIWNLNISGNIFRMQYKTDDWFGLSYNRHKWVGRISVNNTVVLLQKPMITLNVNGVYRSKTIQGVWDFGHVWGIDAGIKWEIIKDKAILNFQCEDMFNSIYPMIRSRYATQHLDLDSRFYQRCFTVSFSYKFKGYKERDTKSVNTSRFGI